MKLEELRVYQKAMDIADDIWRVVLLWDSFSKETVGKQLIRAIDSVAANVSEGYGRYHFKEAKHFYYYSRGSLFETKTWLNKALNRSLITNEKFKELILELDSLGIKLNNFINSIGQSKNQ